MLIRYNNMKKINTLLALLSALLLLGACEKDGEKFYLSSPVESDLIASTNAVVLTEATAKLYALSLAWSDQTLQISDPRYQATSGIQTTVQVSRSEDFSGSIIESTENGVSKSYTVAALNIIAYKLNAPAEEAAPLYFRLAGSNGSNIAPVYSNTVAVTVTPYPIDMHYASIINKGSGQDSGQDFYSANADGQYSGFFGAAAWEGIYVQEADGTTWHTAQSGGVGTPFLLTTDAAEGTWDMWFPGQSGCYFVNVNTAQKQWNALLIPELNVSGIEGINMQYSRTDNQWKGVFTGTEGTNINIQLQGTGKFYNNTSVSGSDNAIDDTKAKDTPFAFGGTAGQLTFSTGETATAGNITVSVPATGECTLVIDLNNPEQWTVSVTEGGSSEPTYPSYLEMQGVGNMDGKGWLATLNPVYDNSGEHHGSYQGVYQMTNGWDNFKIVDQTAGIWYGCDSNDEYKLADGGQNIWFHQEECRTFIVTASLADMTWGATEITQINVCGEFNNWDLNKDLMTYDETNKVWKATVIIDNLGNNYGFYFLLNNAENGLVWNWALKGNKEKLYLTDSNGSGSIVPAETGTYAITLDIASQTFTMDKQ